MPFQWVYAKPEREKSVHALQDQLNVPPVIARLLAIRGINSFDTAKTFFRPELSMLHDPYTMKDMELGATRLAEAVRNREKILVYGDYDVDGTTSTAMLYTFLKDFGVDVDYYIPHRFKEGYGINPEGIEYAIQEDADLIVSIDCGITAVEEAKYARQKGIDLIICDHHTVGEQIPECVAVLDPKRPDCDYPFDGLSGAGVGFKLIQATCDKLGLPQNVAFKFLDLVAISIASDIVPIVNENRVLMREGLHLINNEPRTGLKGLLDLIKLKPGHISTSNIVFSIGPRINAAGRMGDAKKAVQLLIAETRAEAMGYAQQLESINIKRRDKDTSTMEEAVDQVERLYDIESTATVVLHNPEWHLGVIGIVASRLVDQFYRPAIMLSTVDGKIKGSARSIKGFNIYNALKECEDLLEQFGGHQYAAGMTLPPENLEEFRERLNTIVQRRMNDLDAEFEPELTIDAQLDLSEVDLRFWKLLSQFEPFGPQNMRPVFVSKGVEIVGIPTIVGSGHLKMKVKHNGSGVFDVIGFNMHEYLPALRNCPKGSIDLAYVLEENHWNGKRSLQIRLKDIHVNKDRCIEHFD
jgi:single-stranded-DNA-specific exonuclease